MRSSQMEKRLLISFLMAVTQTKMAGTTTTVYCTRDGQTLLVTPKWALLSMGK